MEKRAAQKEREELLANFEQHQQLEKQQQEEKRKVGSICHAQLCSLAPGTLQFLILM